ncbi:MAG: hypothetical protein PHZ04_00400 [Patescibacteria group bacterium]|nr:hypothetical protein [Patescibacteria group bacterium]MDD5555047.1 hypothetical protein [Patescibacteria group bacterium]
MDKGKNGKGEQIGQKINVLLSRYFKWLVVFFVLVVFALGYFLLLKPKYDEIAKLASDGQSDREQEYLERRTYLDSLENLVAVFRSVKLSDQEKIDYILKKKDVPEELFSQIEAIVKKNGLLLKSLKIEPVEAESKSSSQKVSRTTEEKAVVSLPPEIGKTKATIEVMGIDYFGLKSLLTSIENNLMLMDVVSMDFVPAGNSVQLTFYTYYLKE